MYNHAFAIYIIIHELKILILNYQKINVLCYISSSAFVWTAVLDLSRRVRHKVQNWRPQRLMEKAIISVVINSIIGSFLCCSETQFYVIRHLRCLQSINVIIIRKVIKTVIENIFPCDRLNGPSFNLVAESLQENVKDIRLIKQ